ncbi:hypothetical protein E8E14_010003 [Neopestalotiopsis sp. 37M]|nr:hypothetical protein E8E14_010003 [Neopestalotiopsis sp. 37M]
MNVDDGSGLKVDVEAGDVVVLPAGTAHSSMTSSPDYRYIGVYPYNCPKWSNETGKSPPEVFLDTISEVKCPVTDPVYGEQGPLMRLWSYGHKSLT